MSSGMGSTFSSLGIGSNLNLGGLLDKLEKAQMAQLEPLKQEKASYAAKLSAYGRVQNAVENLESAAANLAKSSLFHSSTVTSNAEGFSVEMSGESVPSSYRVQVNNLARRQTLVTSVDNGQASATEALGKAGQITISVGSGAKAQSVTINVTQSQTSLNGLRDAINEADIAVRASVINDGSENPYRLVLTATQTGTNGAVTVNAGSGTELSSLIDFNGSDGAPDALTEAQSPRNANITVNGITIQSQSNTVTDAIPGVTLTLVSETDAPERLTVSHDTKGIENAIQRFVSAYNEYRAVIDNQTEFNGPEAQSGVLLGDSLTRSITTRLREVLTRPASDGQFSMLYQIGISIEKDGSLTLDQSKLENALETSRVAVRKLLAGNDSGNEGIADLVEERTTQLTDSNGLLTNAQENLEQRIRDAQERIESRKESIENQIDRKRQRFIQLDQTIASLNSTSQYLSQQFGSDDNSGGIF